MVFSSLTFLFFFFPIVIALYFFSESLSRKNLILFIASLVFYAWGEPVYVVLMIISTINDYYHSIWIDFCQRKNRHGLARLFLITSIIVNLGLLSYYKYGDFVINNVNRLFHTDIGLLNLALPVGISFYTFQTMSYTIDVYRRNVKVQKNFLTLSAYVTMFPQLIAGPIVRYETIEQELTSRQSTWNDTAKGIRRFIIGLGKKVIIANQMGIIADSVFSMNYQDRGFSLAWIGVIAYAFQIYFDFSGYSDMAIGMGWMFGFHFLENFRYPYIATSITDFWRRWHISLSTWFRDYLYIPLGGNRVSEIRWIFNIMLVWTITGLWHGAAWNFVIWGFYYGFILVVEKLWSKVSSYQAPWFIAYPFTMLLVLFGWVLFRAESLFGIFSYTLSMVGYFGNNSIQEFMQLNLLYLLPFLLLAAIGSTPLMKNIMGAMSRRALTSFIVDIFLVGVLIVSVMFLVNSSFNPFIYYRF